MAFKLNHVHLKSPDPKETADFYVNNLGATVVAETANGGFRLDLHGLPLNVTGMIDSQTHDQVYRHRAHRHRHRRHRRHGGVAESQRGAHPGGDPGRRRPAGLLLRRPPGGLPGSVGNTQLDPCARLPPAGPLPTDCQPIEKAELTRPNPVAQAGGMGCVD